MPMSDGAVFAGYTIVGSLGSGGMGEVYLVRHPRLPRQEALTILPATMSADPHYRQRFNEEADLAARLEHPHIAAVRDRGEEDGHLWITVDHIDGTDAATLVADEFPEGLPPKDVGEIIAAIADALDYAHEQHLVHLGVSPANVLLTKPRNGQRRILLTGFGIARPDTDNADAVNYRAPEQLMGEHVDDRSDQYALAATAYHLLTGTAPYANPNTTVVISRHLNTPPPRLTDTHAHLGALNAVIAKGMAKNHADRCNTCGEFAQALTDAIDTGHTSVAIGTSHTRTPPIAAATTADDRPEPPITFSDWGTPTPPLAPKPPPLPAPPTPAPTPGQSSPFSLKWVPGIVGAAVVLALFVALIAAIVGGNGDEPAGNVTAAPSTSATTPWSEVLDKTRTVTKTAPPVTITQPAAPPPVQTPRRTPFVPPAPAPTTQRTTPRTAGNGDLGLRQPIRNPMCNGQGIVVVGSVTTPGRYAEGVQRLLDRYPGSSYLRTDQTCPSLRQATPEGHPIYAVYLPGGTTGSQLCAAVNAVGGGAYGKWLNYTDDPTIPIRC